MTREFILQKTISDNPDLTFEECAIIAMELYSQQVAKEAAADGFDAGLHYAMQEDIELPNKVEYLNSIK